MGDSASRRSIQLHVFMTPEEQSILDEQAERFGMTRSEFVRFAIASVSACSVDPDDPSPSLAYIDAETWRHIYAEFRIHGVNLNQAAHSCNTLVRMVVPYLRQGRDDAEEMAGFLRTLNDARNILGALLEENLELGRKVREALSLDSLIKIDRGWHHAGAEDQGR